MQLYPDPVQSCFCSIVVAMLGTSALGSVMSPLVASPLVYLFLFSVLDLIFLSTALAVEGETDERAFWCWIALTSLLTLPILFLLLPVYQKDETGSYQSASGATIIATALCLLCLLIGRWSRRHVLLRKTAFPPDEGGIPFAKEYALLLSIDTLTELRQNARTERWWWDGMSGTRTPGGIAQWRTNHVPARYAYEEPWAARELAFRHPSWAIRYLWLRFTLLFRWAFCVGDFGSTFMLSPLTAMVAVAVCRITHGACIAFILFLCLIPLQALYYAIGK